MPTYEMAKRDVLDHVSRMMERHHGRLHEAGVTVDVLMVGPTISENGESSGPPLKIKGYPCVAIVKSNALRDRAVGMSDAMLQIDEDRWKELSAAQRDALIDHELEHLDIKTDKDGHTVLDDMERPKLHVRPHDTEIGWFDGVARRHGKDALEFQQFNTLWNRCHQLKLPFTDAMG